MAEEPEDGAEDLIREGAALNFALSTAPESAQAKAYLARQTELADLQAQKMREEMPLELSHLRFRKFADISKSALEIAVGLVVLLIVCAIGAMVWSAMRDRDLVVEAFSVPPDIAERGMTGAVLAGRVLDRFGQMQADTIGTIQGAGSYRSGNSEQSRLEIPETGVSLSEVDRYLRIWLGHETHVTGDLVHTDKGLALTVRYGAQPGVTEEAQDLPTLIEKSAEHVYASARPYRYVEYLTGKRRYAEALTIIPDLAAQGSPQDRALAYLSWGTIFCRQFKCYDAVGKYREAVRLDTDNPVAHAWLSAAESNVGHEEQGYLQGRETILDWHGPAIADLDPMEAALLPTLFTAYVDDLDGDYSDALEKWKILAATGWGGYQLDSDAGDSASDHDFERATRVAAGVPEKNRSGQPNDLMPLTQFGIAWLREDWTTTLKWADKTEGVLDARPEGVADERFQFWPQWAYAKSRAGDTAGANALISKTPLGCDLCARMRGRIAAVNHDWAGAARWFAMVSARSPHIPYADTDWGAMLLAKGDTDAAIAKFKSADEKGPHFADPLEMWGEALMAKNRSDLALAKFEEADKYAPNWGRLHLEWGEALFYAGKKEEAQKQFAIATGLDLSSADRGALQKWESRHG
jgi:tetratricopeptide (TPR) repeat protein